MVLPLAESSLERLGAAIPEGVIVGARGDHVDLAEAEALRRKVYEGAERRYGAPLRSDVRGALDALGYRPVVDMANLVLVR